ncbi:MAG: S9 family peptidase [Bacteroidales bacterium]|nr:S9 family peptidase [Bacteroidales bacterium]
MKKIVRSFAILSLLVVTLCAAGQEGLLTLEDIYTKGIYRSEYFGPARWVDGGAGYTTLERSPGEKGTDIVRYDSKTGEKSLLVSAADLIPEESSEPLMIDDYSWSPDNTLLLVFTNSSRVWRYNTRGDYWVFNTATRKLFQLGTEMPPSSMMFAKFSPDGSKVAYVCNRNIFVEDLASGETKQITFDGSDKIINGTFDWVYEEELDCRDGFRWSPDSRHIAYWQLDTEGTDLFYLINNTDSLYPKLTAIPYPKVGRPGSAARIGVIPSGGGGTVWIKTEGDPRDNYLARMEFASSSDRIVIQQINRLQNHNKVIMADIASGKVTTVFEDTDEAWVNVCDDMVWLENGKWFTFMSERGGWRQLYKVSRDGTKVINLTPGEYDIINLITVNEKSGYLYFTASPDDPTARYLYRVSMDGKGKAERLTPSDLSGHNSYQISPDTRYALHTYSSAAVPNRIGIVSLPDHKPVRQLIGNESLTKSYTSLKISQKEFFTVDIGDGVILYCSMIKPYDFDPSKKYPVIFHVYGEPAGSTVQNSFGGGDLWHQFLAQQGYIIMSVDNRGTAMFRGREWRKCIYGQIGIMASHDQARAALKIMETCSFVDPERIGIWGWSGGGSMTLNCMFRYPDIYRTGIAIAFVSNQKFYDSIYQERYMGLPDTNEDGYRNGSPVTHAAGLKGNLLLIHGTGDDNVHYQNMEYLVNELIRQNKIFSMIGYPNRSHGIYEGPNTTRHLYETMFWYLRKNLPAGGR